MRRVFFSLAFSSLFIGGGVALFVSSFSMRRPVEQVEKTEIQVAVEVLKIRRRNYIETITAYGWSRALNQTIVKSQISGVVTEISERLQAGQNVIADEIAVKLDNYQQRMTIKEIQAQLKELSITLKILDVDINNLNKEIALMKDELDTSQRDLDRYEKLRGQEGVAEASYDDRIIVHSTRKRAHLKLQWRKKQKEMEMARVKAQLEAKKSRLYLLRHELSKTIIKAPYTGQIVKRYVSHGSWVSPGTPLFEIVDQEKIEVELSLASSYTKKITRNSKVKLYLQQDGPIVWQGKMSRIANVVNKQYNFYGYIDIDKSTILPGMFMIAEVEGPIWENIFVIPRIVLEGNKVFAIERTTENKARIHEVEVNIVALIGDDAIIDQGITAGCEIVVGGMEKIVHGSSVVVFQK